MAPAPPDLQKLVDLVARLRAPDGCPWDREQKLADTRAYLIEEAHEGILYCPEIGLYSKAEQKGLGFLLGKLEKHNVTLVATSAEPLGNLATEGKFDPHVHEALLSQPSDAEEGSVIDVVQKGYTLGDRVVRPARVVIAAAPPEASDG